MGRRKILRGKSQVKLTLPQIILLWVILQPCQLQFKVAAVILEIGDDKSIGGDPPDLL